ncbi:MAG: hypothetical protein Kow0042_26190 [Calditrichia bacterium]
MAETNLFQELKDALQDFKDFLDENVPIIKPAIQALASLIPQINDLLDSLADLLVDLKNEIQNLNVSSIPGLNEVSSFTEKMTTMLETAKNLLPQQTGTINEVLSIASVVTSLPSLEDLKAEIIALLDAIIAHVNSLKSA